MERQRVADDHMLGMALHLRDQELSLREIAARLVITKGARKGQHPSPATVMWMLREHDEQTAHGARGGAGGRREHRRAPVSEDGVMLLVPSASLDTCEGPEHRSGPSHGETTGEGDEEAQPRLFPSAIRQPKPISGTTNRRTT
ncbi:hypothetical protein ACWCQZ_46875 [Streptomyces sp. NPDC002285]